ncbi:YwmB family TATA-box binding protein [Bacillus sp. FJAT-49736]|uniref:YwmB family TATA-box binding protein n=1 Tax=Bacillus sp. FJAT-49736 TaxID=2833582 RepID=UPI001BC932A8|nr:YwmB family TATA-box binding protein [Bacillus sp. FJAT-49736]MBS4175433.1 YwmB family TATA-box binding protein [Bacillus sp. FJAT-49736]
MKSKMIFLIFVFSACFMLVNYGNKTSAESFITDINKIAEMVKGQKGSIDEWSLYARESIDIHSMTGWEKEIKTLKKQFPLMEWFIDQKSGIATGIVEHKDYVETIKLMSTPRKNSTISYLLYEIKGHSWNSSFAKKIDQILPEKLDVLYREKPTIFSCIKGEFNDKIENVLLKEKEQLLHEFQAKEIEALKEKDFYSVSAFSPLFTESIPTKNKKMNLQIGLRKNGLGAKTTFVIGTPIITIEY